MLLFGDIFTVLLRRLVAQIGVARRRLSPLSVLLKLSAYMNYIILHLLALVSVEAFATILRYENNLSALDQVWIRRLYVELGELVDLRDVVHSEDASCGWSESCHGSCHETRASTDIQDVRRLLQARNQIVERLGMHKWCRYGRVPTYLLRSILVRVLTLLALKYARALPNKMHIEVAHKKQLAVDAAENVEHLRVSHTFLLHAAYHLLEVW